MKENSKSLNAKRVAKQINSRMTTSSESPLLRNPIINILQYDDIYNHIVKNNDSFETLESIFGNVDSDNNTSFTLDWEAFEALITEYYLLKKSAVNPLETIITNLTEEEIIEKLNEKGINVKLDKDNEEEELYVPIDKKKVKVGIISFITVASSIFLIGKKILPIKKLKSNK